MKTQRSLVNPVGPAGLAIQEQAIALQDADFKDGERLKFHLFDPALGRLTAILITCETRLMLFGAVMNRGTTPQSITISVAAAMELTLPAGLPPAALDTTPTVSSFFSLPPGGVANMPWNAGCDEKLAVFAAPGDLPHFTGLGSWILPAAVKTTEVVIGAGEEIQRRIRAKAGFDVMVQYEFIPSPMRAGLPRGLQLVHAADATGVAIFGWEDARVAAG